MKDSVFLINTVHLEIRQFLCDQCSRSFTSKKNLKVHQCTHTEERLHQCPYCNKGCKTKQNLATHIRIHTGE